MAPSILQHEIKSLSHRLIQQTVDKLLSINTADLLEPEEPSKLVTAGVK